MQRDIKGQVTIIRNACINIEYIRQLFAYQFGNELLRLTAAAAEGSPAFCPFVCRDDAYADARSETVNIKSCVFTDETGVLQSHIIKCYRLYGMVGQLGLHTRRVRSAFKYPSKRCL